MNGVHYTCSLIMIHLNALMMPIHDRMPVILPESSYATWLYPKLHNPIFLTSVLQPYDADAMDAFPVSAIVNNPRHDQSDCVKPV